MARGARATLKVDFALATTGIAGPDGGKRGKTGRPRMVCIVDDDGIVTTHRATFPGQRMDVRDRAAMTASASFGDA